MTRTKTLKNTIRELIDDKRKPTVQLLAKELSWTQEDVHSCLNTLEKKGEVKTYAKEILGQKNRFVSLRR